MLHQEPAQVFDGRTDDGDKTKAGGEGSGDMQVSLADALVHRELHVEGHDERERLQRHRHGEDAPQGAGQGPGTTAGMAAARWSWPPASA